MSCYSELICSMYADNELPGEDRLAFESHLAACVTCRERTEAILAENLALGEALEALPAAAAVPARDAAVTIAAAWLVGSAAGMIWPAEQPMSWLITAFWTAGWHGSTALAVIAVGVLCLKMMRRIPAAGALAALMLMLANPSFGITKRSGEGTVTIAATETIEDSVLAAGELVRVEGTINGDLLAMGRDVEITGNVKGTVMAFAQNVNVRGTVLGSVIVFAQRCDLAGRVEQSVYAGLQTLVTAPGSRIGHEVLAGGARIQIDGEVVRSVTTAAELTSGRGTIGGDLNVYGNRLEMSPEAKIGGQTAIHRKPRVNRFTQFSFYWRKLIGILAALAAAWVFRWIAPGFFAAATARVSGSWRVLLIGLLAAIVTPLLVIALAVSRVGLPLALGSAVLFGAGLYLAKILVGGFLGGLFIRGQPMIALAAGLVALAILWEIPFVGTVVMIAVLAAGLGAFLAELWRRIRRPAVVV